MTEHIDNGDSRLAKVTQSAARGLVYAAALSVAAYAARAGLTWFRYGKPKACAWCERDELLDCFMPLYDVEERHHIRVGAPAAATFAAACMANLDGSWLVNAIFKTREVILGGTPAANPLPDGLLPRMEAIGWRVLLERPGCELVLGAVTKPWDAHPTFRSIPADQFAGFDEPGYVKIVWTLRADPLGDRESMARTETRAVATDEAARAKFRRYWTVFSPGIVLIRRSLLKQIKRAAERMALEAHRPTRDRFESASKGDLDQQC